jgi:hypothetical protein
MLDITTPLLNVEELPAVRVVATAPMVTTTDLSELTTAVTVVVPPGMLTVIVVTEPSAFTTRIITVLEPFE